MTDTVLRVDSSAPLATSTSRALTDRIVEHLAPAHVVTRDLTASLPFVDADWVDARLVPAAERTPEQAARLQLSDELIAEIRASDTLVIGLPVYNFMLPVALKAWIDLVARPGETFRYTSTGPEGLLSGKRVIVAFASGGTAVGSPIDFATPYLRHVLGFIGIDDVTFVTKAEMDADPETALSSIRGPAAQAA